MAQPTDTAFQIEKIDVFVLRVPADPPVQTSFGTMKDRPAVLLRVVDRDGAHGWGEIWSNFPTVGAEHRGRMAATYLPPLACGRRWESPRACFAALTEQLAVLALQTGEPGPIQQVLAGLDIALWDLVARRAGLPLWQLLGAPPSAAPPSIALYASGINPTAPEKLAAHKLAEGYRAFKLKVGFGAERDLRNLAAVREVIGQDLPFMVDANQAWSMDEAIAAGRRMAGFGLGWLEEPVRADTPNADWTRIAREQPLPLAGGENLAGVAPLAAFAATPGVAVVQPDIGKWGGFSGCVEVGRAVLAQGKRFCPHWLGAGVGLTASLHLKAAVGGPGYVEVDANPNLLRDLFAGDAFQVNAGQVSLHGAPGLGIEPDLAACRDYLTYQA
ncbi:MAG: mandelate racemase/muconate lactonizing enzyme family protein [Comamonas sp.]